MYMIKTYIIKIQSRNLIHDNRLLAIPKISFHTIPKNKDPHPVKNDPDSESIFLNLNRDHFWLDDPVKDLCFSGSFERKFLEQPTAYYHVWGFVIKFWWCTSLSCTLCTLSSLKKKYRINSLFNTLWAWTRFKKPTVLFKILTIMILTEVFVIPYYVFFCN